MSQRQMEIAVAIGAGVLIVIIAALVFMARTFGLVGTLLWLFGAAALVGGSILVWRQRRKIASHIERRRQEAAARAGAAAAALAAAEARKPRPLRGNFPATVTFFGPNDRLDLDRGSIKHPLVYVVAGGVGDTSEPSLIGSNLIVAPPAGRCDEPLPYWPNYHSATPAQRSVYLNWLIGGRRQLPPEIGYAFMFFYGLERRAVADQEDIAVIIDEIIRLRKLNAESAQPNRSFESYTGSFLWFLAAAFASRIEPTTVRTMAQSTRTWHEENLSAALGWYVQTGLGLPVWLALEVAGQLPGSQRSVVIDRVGEKFRELFTKRYSEQFIDGLTLISSKRRRTYQYKTASAVLGTVEFSAGPNPLGLMSQFKPLSDLWNECSEDLRQLSSVVRREGDVPLTPAMWEALPDDIRAATEHPLQDAVCRLVQESTDDEGRTLVAIRKLAKVLCWEIKDRCSLSESTWISQTLEECGYCLEPDARLTKIAYKPDEVVTAFLRMTDLHTTTSRYAAAACMLRFGLAVASADGHMAEDELSVLMHDLEQMFDLNEHEHRRLTALRTLICATSPDLAGLSQMTKMLQPEHREAIGKLLLVLAAKDGEVTKEEIRAIRKCYKTLGFAQAEIGHALASLKAYQADEEPVTIRPGIAPSAGEAIPAPKGRAVLKLNRAAIAQIMADTREVAQMLADAMSSGEQPGQVPFSTPFVPPSSVPTPSVVTAMPSGDQTQTATADGLTEVAVPPQRYASLYQLLISKQEWDVKEIDGVARQQGLMLSGAIDALNEWAAEKYGGQLFVEDGGKIIVERAYLN
jgi:uncharacterized tellurite resistance protein B-like protein